MTSKRLTASTKNLFIILDLALIWLDGLFSYD